MKKHDWIEKPLTQRFAEIAEFPLPQAAYKASGRRIHLRLRALLATNVLIFMTLFTTTIAATGAKAVLTGTANPLVWSKPAPAPAGPAPQNPYSTRADNTQASPQSRTVFGVTPTPSPAPHATAQVHRAWQTPLPNPGPWFGRDQISQSGDGGWWGRDGFGGSGSSGGHHH